MASLIKAGNLAQPSGRRQHAFTLIELLVVMAIVASLASLVAPAYVKHNTRSKETVLRHNLQTLRQSLDDYRVDRGAPPDSLEQLVDQRYLRVIPLDPFTGQRDSWLTEADEDGKISNVISAAQGRALDGSGYETW